MARSLQDFGIDQLSTEHRLWLIGEIWDSLNLEGLPIPTDHREELDRRLAAADAEPQAGMPWEEVRARLRADR